VAVPVTPSRGPRRAGRLSGAQRLVVLAWAQLALTVCGVVFGIAVTRVLIEGGNAMACFDGDELACANGPITIGDQRRSLIVGAALIALAAAAVIVAHLHRRGRTRRFTSIGALSMSAALDGLAAIALLSL
jgi:hypothetical protein